MAFNNKLASMLRLNDSSDDIGSDGYMEEDDERDYRRSRSRRSRYDDDDEDEDERRPFRSRYDDDDDEEEPPRSGGFFSRGRSNAARSDRSEAGNAASRTSPVNLSGSLASGDPGSEVRVFHPTNLDEARKVTDTLLNRQSAILNLEGLDLTMAQRIIDFVGGSNYAIKGHFTRISNFVFLFTPLDVDIAGDIVQGSMEASQEMGSSGNGLNVSFGE